MHWSCLGKEVHKIDFYLFFCRTLHNMNIPFLLFQESQRPPSKSALLKICNEAILTYPLYENLSIVSMAFGLCKSAARADKDLVNDTILKLLAFPDIQVSFLGWKTLARILFLLYFGICIFELFMINPI